MRPKPRRYGRNRVYLDLDRPVPGKKNTWEKIPGVTTLIREGLPKEVFARYAGTATAEYAVNNWAELDALPPAERLARLNKGRYENRDKAADRGQEIHELARQLARDAEVPVPKELRGYVTAAVRFMDEFDLRPVAEELAVFSETDYWGGRLDVIGSVEVPDLDVYDWIPRDDDGRANGLFDYKSGSGIFGELGFQLGAYRHAEFAIDEDVPDGADPEIIDMPPIDFGAGVHLRPDGTYSVIPVDTSRDVYDDFLAIKATADVADRVQGLILTQIVPPRTARYRLTLTEPGASDD
jgi:hypothetical protein